MTYINMVYLAMLTSRTPVIPPFVPSHVDYDGGFPPFDDVFDVLRLAAAINMPILEWRDVKQENGTASDELGCWTCWLGGRIAAREPGHSPSQTRYAPLFPGAWGGRRGGGPAREY
jgi:hypothetical protein